MTHTIKITELPDGSWRVAWCVTPGADKAAEGLRLADVLEIPAAILTVKRRIRERVEFNRKTRGTP
jgi:hypothetical protein